jgi:hypothetical protein
MLQHEQHEQTATEYTATACQSCAIGIMFRQISVLPKLLLVFTQLGGMLAPTSCRTQPLIQWQASTAATSSSSNSSSSLTLMNLQHQQACRSYPACCSNACCCRLVLSLALANPNMMFYFRCRAAAVRRLPAPRLTMTHSWQTQQT